MIEEYQAGDEPVRDGQPWPYIVINTAGASLAADTLSELVDTLFPEHAALDVDGQFELRLRALAESAQSAQAVALANLAATSTQDEPLPDAAVTAATAQKAGPIVELPSWPFDLPLYLLATQYAPFSDVPAPVGERVVLLDPSTERTFLEGLAAAGDVEFLVNAAALGESEATADGVSA